MDASSTNLALLFMGLVTGIALWQWGNIRRVTDNDDFLSLLIAIIITVITIGVARGIAIYGY